MMWELITRIGTVGRPVLIPNRKILREKNLACTSLRRSKQMSIVESAFACRGMSKGKRSKDGLAYGCVLMAALMITTFSVSTTWGTDRSKAPPIGRDMKLF